MGGEERRRFTRAPEACPSKCRRARSGEPWQEIQTINISASGLRFLSKLPFEVSDEVELEMELPASGGELKVTAAVVWVKSPAAGVVELGVEFKALTPDLERQIDDVVEFLMKHPRPMRPVDPERS